MWVKNWIKVFMREKMYERERERNYEKERVENDFEGQIQFCFNNVTRAPAKFAEQSMRKKKYFVGLRTAKK